MGSALLQIGSGLGATLLLLLGFACKDIQYFRQLSTDLGWPLDSPTIVYADNKTMISLVVAPQISARSRHSELVHHLICKLFAGEVLVLTHVPAADMRADMPTQLLPKCLFLIARGCCFAFLMSLDSCCAIG